MSSIITHTFLTLRKRPKRETAGMMLCAILSDTLNLQSPTTTEWDRLMVSEVMKAYDYGLYCDCSMYGRMDCCLLTCLFSCLCVC